MVSTEPRESSLVRSISGRVGRAAGFESESSGLSAGSRSVMFVFRARSSSVDREERAWVMAERSGDGVTAEAVAV